MSALYSPEVVPEEPPIAETINGDFLSPQKNSTTQDGDGGNVDVVNIEADNGDFAEFCTPKKIPTEDGKDCVAPRVGQTYGSWLEIEDNYRAWSKTQGFGIIRDSSSYKGKKGVDRRRRCVLWRCDCSGVVRRKKAGDDLYENGVEDILVQPSILTRKLGCGALVYGSLQRDESWKIGRVVLDHNHVVTPRKSLVIHQHRVEEFHTHLKNRVINDVNAGLKLPQVIQSLEAEREGNLVPTDRDMRHVIQEQRKLRLQDGDAAAMWKYFMMMYANNNNFFHSIRLVDEGPDKGMVKDILWIDARSHAAFEEFGDVVCFDTTYLTNEYDLPFANFVGVNHHGQTILLGCALISHETTETFEWVFQTWKTAMGTAPKGILTDQASAMRTALKNVMPEATHRWCLWHIMRKFPTKLGKIIGYDDFGPELRSAIYDSHTPLEFQTRWEQLIKLYDLSKNEWLGGLYEERKMWVPCFTAHIFWAGMRSTQRVESIHHFFDTYLHKHTRLYEFVENYMKALTKRCKTEKEADDISSRTDRTSQYELFVAEKVFREIYTDAKFKELQVECQRCAFINFRGEKIVSEYVVEHVVEDRVYVHCNGRRDSLPTDRRRNFLVRFNKLTNEVECECKMFESAGILCRHTIKILDNYNVKEIPEKYILRRWRKDVRRKHTLVRILYHDPSKTEEVKRYDRMHVAFEKVCCTAMDSDDATQYALAAVNELCDKVQKMMGVKKGNSSFHDNSPANKGADATEKTVSSVGNYPLRTQAVDEHEHHQGFISEALDEQSPIFMPSSQVESTPGSVGASNATINSCTGSNKYLVLTGPSEGVECQNLIDPHGRFFNQRPHKIRDKRISSIADQIVDDRRKKNKNTQSGSEGEAQVPKKRTRVTKAQKNLNVAASNLDGDVIGNVAKMVMSELQTQMQKQLAVQMQNQMQHQMQFTAPIPPMNTRSPVKTVRYPCAVGNGGVPLPQTGHLSPVYYRSVTVPSTSVPPRAARVLTYDEEVNIPQASGFVTPPPPTSQHRLQQMTNERAVLPPPSPRHRHI